METTTRRQFKSRMDAKQDVWRPIDALMGNGSGTVEVPGQPGYVYIRTSANDLGQAFNNRCPLRDNLAISCGYDPITDPDRRIFQVLSVRMADYANAGNTPILNIPNHHLYHEFGGGDDVYVDWRRLLGFRVGRPSAFTVTIDPGVMMRAGAWIAIAAQTVNLAASQPGGVNSARYVLVALDNTGTITTSNGAIVAAPLLDISDCPVPAAGEIPLAAVRLYTTQTQINDTPSSPDIIDLRFPTTYTTGGSNVYGSGVANRLAYWSAADTLTSSAEMQHLTAVALYIAKALTTIVGNNLDIQSYCTSTIAVDQAGSFVGVGSNMLPDGAADYTGSLENFSAVLEYAGAGSIAEADGYRCRFDVTAAGTIADAKLFRGHIDAGAAGTITLGHGIYIEAPAGTIGTYYGVYIKAGSATAKWSFYAEGDKITTKLAAAAGIELDPNAATGNFTLSLSPTNLTGNHRVSFGDVTGTAALGAGTVTVATTNNVTVASHTHAITSSSNPGAAASILATDASGNLSLSGTFTASGTNYIKQPYGSFSSTADQTVAVINTAYAVAFNTDDIKSGITHSTVINNSRIIIEEYGVYFITVSAVADQTIGTGGHINVWLAVDGAAVANTNTKLELAGNVETTLAVNFIYEFSSAYSFGSATPFFEIMYCSDNTNVRMRATAASAPAPACPSIICTVNKISA